MWIVFILALLLLSCTNENSSQQKEMKLSLNLFTMCKNNFDSAIIFNNETICSANKVISLDDAVVDWDIFNDDGSEFYYIKLNVQKRILLYNYTKSHIGDRLVLNINSIPAFSAVIGSSINNGVLVLPIDFSELPPSTKMSLQKALDNSIITEETTEIIDSSLNVNGLMQVIDVIENIGTAGFIARVTNNNAGSIEYSLKNGRSLVIEPLEISDSIIKVYDVDIRENRIETTNTSLVTLDESLSLVKNMNVELINETECSNKNQYNCLVNSTIANHGHNDKLDQIIILIPNIYYKYDGITKMFNALKDRKERIVFALRDNNKINVINNDTEFQRYIESNIYEDIVPFISSKELKTAAIIKWSVDEQGKLAAELISENRKEVMEFNNYFSKLKIHSVISKKYHNQVTFTKMAANKR